MKEYTGYTDAIGQKLYEGDIVELFKMSREGIEGKRIVEVIKKNGSFYFKSFFEDNRKPLRSIKEVIEEDGAKIYINSIHENSNVVYYRNKRNQMIKEAEDYANRNLPIGLELTRQPIKSIKKYIKKAFLIGENLIFNESINSKYKKKNEK